jgi:type II secretory pathway component GspD/PulD (secretin)
VRRLLDAVQQNARSSVLQAPKVTTFNDQEASFGAMQSVTSHTPFSLTWEDGFEVALGRTEEASVGVGYSVRPSIAADRRSVALKLDVTSCDVESGSHLFRRLCPTTIRCGISASVPDQQTLLLDMGRRTHEVAAAPIPVLSDLPCIGFLLREFGAYQEVEHVVVLVSPRILVPQEVEEKAPSAGQK